MASIQIGNYGKAAAQSLPNCAMSGDVQTRCFTPGDVALWSASVVMAADGSLTWSPKHGDEAVFVVSGTVAVDGRTCTAEDVVIVESDAEATLHATTDATLVLFGPRDTDPPATGEFGPPQPGHHGVHVVHAPDVTASSFGEPSDGGRRLGYADSQCPTCRITLFSIEANRGYNTGSHLHSQDEIIHVLHGELQVGRDTVGPEMALAVPGDQRYGFRARTDFRFLNYRRDVSTFLRGPQDEPLLETALPSWRPTTFAPPRA